MPSLPEFTYSLTDKWGNKYIGKVKATNASDAFNAAVRKEQKGVRDLEKHIMQAHIVPR